MDNDAIVTSVEQYITAFWDHHEDDYNAALNDAHISYRTSATRHSDDRMARIEDFVDNLEGNIGIIFYQRPLIPAAFTSLQALIAGFNSFSSELGGYSEYIRKHYDLRDVLPSHVSDVYRISEELRSFCVEVLRISTELDMPSPYLKCRSCLYANDIPGFLDLVNQILATVPYSAFKQNVNESFFQVSLLLLLTLLGFDVNSEEATSRGRIDATLILNHTTYIFEFKYSKSGRDLSKTAYKQIIKKDYAEKYKLFSKTITAIGVSFSANTRNINGYYPKDL